MVRAALAHSGITVLENSSQQRGPVTVVGVADGFSGHANSAAALASARALGGIPIILSHTPNVVHGLQSLAPVVLAGHTHCGQIVIPGFGSIAGFSPRLQRSLYDPRYRCGIIRDTGRFVVVTAGLGAGTVPIRIAAPPDWWLLTLTR